MKSGGTISNAGSDCCRERRWRRNRSCWWRRRGSSNCVRRGTTWRGSSTWQRPCSRSARRRRREPACRVRSGALRARWLYWQGDGPGTLDLALRVMDPSRPARRQARALAQTLVAGGLQLQGDIGAARRFYRRLLEGRGGDALPPRALAGLGLLELIAGDLTAVSDVADSIMVKARPLGLTDSVGWSHLFRGVVGYQRDDLDVAEEHFTRGGVASPRCHTSSPSRSASSDSRCSTGRVASSRSRR